MANLWKNMQDTHYQTLRVEENCTDKEIRDAFIRLSKLCHPDRDPSNKDLHSKFVRINEAYEILGKNGTRKQYDTRLAFYRGLTDFDGTYVQRTSAPFRDPSIWAMRDKSKDQKYRKKPIYGIPGIKKVSNRSMAAAAVLLMCFGTALQLVAMRYIMLDDRYTWARRQRNLDETHRQASEHLAMVRRRAEEYGSTEMQLRGFQERRDNYNARKFDLP